MVSYMKHLPVTEQGSADMLLAGVPPRRDPYSNDKPDVSLEENDWMLPCHSLVLSIHSAAFLRGAHTAESFSPKKSADGKRIVRVDATEAAATRLLEHCYHIPGYPSQLNLAELCEMAILSIVQEVPGKLLRNS